ncbi:MAG: exodeoxyribonuclease VII large subunit [Planctomycetota bacterium]
MNQEQTFTISEVSKGIQQALSAAFSGMIWVVGEIQGLDRAKHGKHWYFQLCETDGDGEVYRLSCTLWSRTRDALFGAQGKLKGIIKSDEPLDGIKVRALCKIDFYPPFGKLSLHVHDIDPAYTLGDLEARRQALIEKLTQLGVLHKNREILVPEVPLRIGLITSDGSAAYNDFMKELEHSGFAFKVLLCDARMQGEEAPPTIRRAFVALETLDPDLIVLIRGGGSRLDLSWFDRESVVHCIVGCSRPVITGIGHEIDVTISEMAAHTGLKTPTAAAGYIVDRVRDYLSHVHELGGEIADAVTQRIEAEESHVKQTMDLLMTRIQLGLREGRNLLHSLPHRLISAAGFLVERERSKLTGMAGSLVAGRNLRQFEDQRIRLSNAALQLCHRFARRRESETHVLDLWAERCRLLDPVRTLDRGYALLRDAEGRTIKSVKQLAPEDCFFIKLRDGNVEARAEKIHKEGNHDGKEKRQLEIW